jgi:hypothetical protein
MKKNMMMMMMIVRDLLNEFRYLFFISLLLT